MVAINSRNSKKISRPARNVNLVVSAMRNLSDENGCTIGNIVGYISDYCDNPAPKREVVAALKRGVEFGIVDRKRGRYLLTDRIETSDERNQAPSHSSSSVDTMPSDVVLQARRAVTRSRKSTRRGTSRARESTRRRRTNKKSLGRKSKRARFSGPSKSHKLSDCNRELGFRAHEAPSDESIESSVGDDDHAPSDCT